MPDGSGMAEITITCFDSFAARQKTERRVSWHQLRHEILTTFRSRKENLPWLKLARFGDKQSDKGSLRHDANVLSITGIEADYDKEQLGVDWAVDLLEHLGIRAMVYTSPSHTPDAPRWRILCPTSRELPPGERARLMDRLARIFGDVFANESWTLSQAYFYGAVVGNMDHQVHLVDGIPIDLAGHLDGDRQRPSDQEPYGERPRSDEKSFDEAALFAEITSGKGFHRPCVRLLGKWAQDGVAYMAARKRLRDAFEQIPEPDRTERWHARFNDIDRCLDGIYGKEAGKRDTADAEQKERHQNASTSNGWPDPIDFLGDENLTGLPVLEPEHVPQVLYDFAIDTAERMGVDPISVALTALVACASVMDEEFHLQPKQHDTTWTEEARLWTATVGAPSVLKTPVIRACTRPIDRLDADGRRQHEEDFADYQRDLKEWEAGDKDPDRKPVAPRMPRYLVESTTIEALAEVLRDDPAAKFTAPAKRVLLRQDEMGEWIAGFDRYKAGGRGGSDRGAYLRLYNGGRHVVDRVGRGSFGIPHWSACIIGGIQPELIQRIAHESADDGLLQRFMYCVPGTSHPG